MAVGSACGSPAAADDEGGSTTETDTDTGDENSGDVGETGDDGECGNSGCPCANDDACDAGLECAEGLCSPPGSVPVPGSEFFRGCNEALDSGCLPDEFPGGTVFVSDFFIDVTEVTQAAFQACVDAGDCTPPHDAMTCVGKHTPVATPDSPVRCIDWAQAGEFCAWRGGRLPTEAEWEKAARGEDGATYPWGDSPAPSCSIVVADEGGEGCGTGDVQPVGSRPEGASPYGALDTLGNVAEWTQSWLADDYTADPGPDPKGPASGTYRACRGGSFGWPAADVRAARRSGAMPDTKSDRKGVRCAYDWP